MLNLRKFLSNISQTRLTTTSPSLNQDKGKAEKTKTNGRAKKQKAKSQHGVMAKRNRFKDIKAILQNPNPVIVDGGANRGNIINIFLRQYAEPTIYAFEPIPAFAQALQEKYADKEKVHIFQKALGSEPSTVAFNILNAQNSSSIFSPGEWNHKYHGDRMAVAEVANVELVRLDQALPVDAVDILKLDLQGYELQALKGAGQLLERVKVIVTEVEFVPLYENQPLFGDIDVFLRQAGFRLLNLYDLYTHPDGQLTSGDAVYLNVRNFFIDSFPPLEVNTSLQLKQDIDVIALKSKKKNLSRQANHGRASQAAIDQFRSDPNNPFLVSFPRTGSHWLRSMMELYFDRPMLVRSFFKTDRDDYLLLHTHDMNLTERPENVIYLYRDPVDTIYSQLRYYQQAVYDKHLAIFWAQQYALHLAHWMFESDFATRKTVITYEQIQGNTVDVFQRLSQHFNMGTVDSTRLHQIKQSTSKKLLKEKTDLYDKQVVNAQIDVEAKEWFKQHIAQNIWDAIAQTSQQLYGDPSKIKDLFTHNSSL